MTSGDNPDTSPPVIRSFDANPIKKGLSLKLDMAIIFAVIAVSMIIGYVLLFYFRISQYLIVIFILLMSTSIFIVLFAHIVMIKSWGLRVYDTHFEPPHQGLYALIEGNHKSVLFKDIDIAYLHRSQTKNRTLLKIKLFDGKSIVIRQGDFGIKSESFEALIKQIEMKHKLDTVHFRS